MAGVGAGMTETEMWRATNTVFLSIFHRVIPPDTRLWMSDCIGLDVHRTMHNFSIETRLKFDPSKAGAVVPQTPIYMQWSVDEQAMSSMVGGQMDFIHKEDIEDFLLKCLMVYSIKGFDYDVNGGWK